MTLVINGSKRVKMTCLFQDYGRRNPNQDQQLHTLAVNHGKEMEHLHLRNRDLERKRDGEYSTSSLLNYSFNLFDLILYVPSTIFQLNREGSSWVEPVLS